MKKMSDSLTNQDASARNKRLAKLQRESLDRYDVWIKNFKRKNNEFMYRSVDKIGPPTQQAVEATRTIAAKEGYRIPRVAMPTTSNSSTPANTPRMANHMMMEGISPTDAPRAGPSTSSMNIKGLTLCKRVPCTRSDCFFVHTSQGKCIYDSSK